MTHKYYIGIDIGSTNTKGVVVDRNSQVCASAAIPSGMDFKDAAAKIHSALLEASQISKENVGAVVTTGYGRKNTVLSDNARTEISCHGRGAHFHFPQEITVVDIGGQDNKIIRVSKTGKTLEFKMNRKCAAGTGAFLEEIARRIEIPMDQLEDLAQKSTTAVQLGSFCTVFSITEVLALIRKGTSVPDIVHAAFGAVVKRVVEMDELPGKVVATGGVVAHNPIILELLGRAIGRKVHAPPAPLYSGALGAALFAMDQSPPGT